ncbi:MAG: DNA repair protein RecO [Anaerolinea sp.]|nr:DNA repair protein RecO [Anaerolinea sp.]
MPRPERSYRTPAIILKRFDLGEADRLLTLFTPLYGKLEAIAKGARKLTSHKTGHVELFTRAEMLLHRGRELDIVAQSEMTAPYLALREDLVRGAYANYCAELLDRFTSSNEADGASRLFTLFDETLARLCDDADPRLAVRYFEIHLLDIVGYRPELSRCVIGGETIQAEDQYFSYVEGGAVCPKDAVRGSAATPIAMPTLKLMRHMQRSPYGQVRALTVPPDVHDELERIQQGYITHLLERRLQSVDFIRRVR